MRWYYKLPLRLRSLFQRNRTEGDLNEELQSHLHTKSTNMPPKGWARKKLEHAALRSVGGIDKRRKNAAMRAGELNRKFSARRSLWSPHAPPQSGIFAAGDFLPDVGHRRQRSRLSVGSRAFSSGLSRRRAPGTPRRHRRHLHVSGDNEIPLPSSPGPISRTFSEAAPSSRRSSSAKSLGPRSASATVPSAPRAALSPRTTSMPSVSIRFSAAASTRLRIRAQSAIPSVISYQFWKADSAAILKSLGRRSASTAYCTLSSASLPKVFTAPSSAGACTSGCPLPWRTSSSPAATSSKTVMRVGSKPSRGSSPVSPTLKPSRRFADLRAPRDLSRHESRPRALDCRCGNALQQRRHPAAHSGIMPSRSWSSCS